MTSTKKPGDKPPRKRRSRKDRPDPEWTYAPPPLSEHAERLLACWVTQHPPTSEQGLTVFLHVPILRQILFWLEQPEGGPTDTQRERAGGHETTVYVASHADLLMFGTGTRAERERVFIGLVEGIALLAFAPGGIPRLPTLCEAHDAQAIADAFTAWKAVEQATLGKDPDEAGAAAHTNNEKERVTMAKPIRYRRPCLELEFDQQALTQPGCCRFVPVVLRLCGVPTAQKVMLTVTFDRVRRHDQEGVPLDDYDLHPTRTPFV